MVPTFIAGARKTSTRRNVFSNGDRRAVHNQRKGRVHTEGPPGARPILSPSRFGYLSEWTRHMGICFVGLSIPLLAAALEILHRLSSFPRQTLTARIGGVTSVTKQHLNPSCGFASAVSNCSSCVFVLHSAAHHVPQNGPLYPSQLPI